MLESSSTDVAPASAVLDHGAALQVRSAAGVLRVSQNDRQDFLHRMTTNEINKVQPGASTVTILTSPTARTLYAFTVVVRDEDLLLLPGAGEAAGLSKHLRGQIFFMDAVTVADVSEEWKRMRLMGPEAAARLADVGIDLIESPDGSWRQVDDLLAIKQERYDVPGFELLVNGPDADARAAQLIEAGALPIDDVTYQSRRIQLGRPAPGAELVESFNPLETNMAWVCADDKGCYTGQEIIARQITYDKVTKMLVGLTSDHPLATGADVMVDGRSMGTVTSATANRMGETYLALAVVKRPANSVGVQVLVDGHQAIIADLPFAGT